MSTSDPVHHRLRVQAREAAARGEPERAREAYAALLQASPADIEGLNFIAMVDLARGQKEQALELLGRALSAAPDDGPTRKNMGLALLQAGRFAEAGQVLRSALQDDPELFVARLYLGLVHERLGDMRAAVVEYFKAIVTAQSRGQWTSPATTPAGVRPVLEHAMAFTRRGRRQLLAAALAPLHERFGRDEMARVDHCLAVYLGDTRAAPPDPRQKPEFMYFPGLPSEPFLPRDRFPWYEAMEAEADAIRTELLAVLGDRPQLEPFLGTPPPGMKSSYLDASSDGATPQWDAFFFHRHGRRFDENCNRCPKTAAALERAPTVRIRGHAPESLFSVLGPGSHILPHHGVTNTRVVTHLPLIVPDDCCLRVADDRHYWKPGQCITFDDTFEHEAWNNSDRTRVILLFDVWNPYLTEAEQVALTDLVATIGDLDAEAV